jgi:hypothetical protein
MVLRVSCSRLAGVDQAQAGTTGYKVKAPDGAFALYSLVFLGAPGRTRTSDARFRKPTLYPLSYGS